MNELISIVVPIYKVEDYLHRCVDSILKQTYKDIEIILVNDGSPDRCGEICDIYAQIDNRVKVIHKKNGGLSDARNVGIEKSTGKYITFVDSDDWIHEEYVERLYSLLLKTGSDISICNFIRVSNETDKVTINQETVYEYSNKEALEQFVNRFYVQMTIACGKLFKKNLFENIRFPFGRKHEDEFTTYKLIYEANKVVLTTKELLYYWQREDSIMGTGFNLKSRLDVIDAFKERAEFFEKINLIDLRDISYRRLFIIYLNVFNKYNQKNETIECDNLVVGFKKLKENLRKGNHSIVFKIFFELYYLMPKLTNQLYKVYSKKNLY